MNFRTLKYRKFKRRRRKYKNIFVSDPIKLKFEEHSMLDDLLSTVRTFHSNWYGSSVSQAKVKTLSESKEFKAFEVDLIGRLVKADGVEIALSRRDDLEELCSKIATLKVLFKDARFELANSSFEDILANISSQVPPK